MLPLAQPPESPYGFFIQRYLLQADTHLGSHLRIFTSGGDIRAWALATDTGYSLPMARFNPRLGLRANSTSGDHGRAATHSAPSIRCFRRRLIPAASA